MFRSRRKREIERLQWEAAEWRKRAELAAAKPPVVVRVEKPRLPLWARVNVAFWLVVIGLMIGGVAVPHASDAPTLEPDYGACVSSRSAQPNFYPQASQYQKLVNALWACEVFHQ